jgi:hypothetical protein
MLVPPPGRLSMMKLWPSRSDNGWAMTRATMSGVLPGGNVITNRTGRAG